MKKHLSILTLLFPLMFSSTSYAEWQELVNNIDGKNVYIDSNRITKQDGYIYWSNLLDYQKPDEFGDLSHIAYRKGDCKLFRFKELGLSFYKEPMGSGISIDFTPSDEWRYPNTNSLLSFVLKFVCRK